MWWGGLSSPARFIGATFLLWSAPAAMAFAEARDRGTRIVQSVALALSVGVTVLFLSAEGGQFAFNVREPVAPWLVWMGQVTDLGRGVPGLFRTTPALAFAEAAVWLAALAGAMVLAMTMSAAAGLRPGAVALARLWAGALAVTLAFAVVWRLDGTTGVSAAAGQIRALESIARGHASTGIVFEPLTLSTPGLALERTRVGLERVSGAPASAWLWVPHVPAGRYRLWVEHQATDAPFDARVLVGRTDAPFDRWHLNRLTAGSSSLELDLPVSVHSVHVTGDEASRRSVRGIWLQPVDAPRGALASIGERASAAACSDVCACSAWATGCTWSRAGSGRPGEGAPSWSWPRPISRKPTCTVGAGAVATPVTITAGDYCVRLDLQAGERREVSIPLRRGEPALVRVEAERGFRPSEVNRRSTDARMLGVRIEPGTSRVLPQSGSPAPHAGQRPGLRIGRRRRNRGPSAAPLPGRSRPRSANPESGSPPEHQNCS